MSTTLGWVNRWVLNAVFAWVPQWFVLTLNTGSISRRLWFTMAFIGVILSGIVVPVIEEMYFRGFLLPRLSHLGLMAVVWNAALMALYHLWTPWLAVTRFVMLLPMVYAVQRNKSIAIGITVHCVANTLDIAASFLA